MRTLDLYILRRVFWPLSAALAITVCALLLERLVRLLDLFVDKGGPLSLIVQMLTNLVPQYLGIALPAAFFVAVLVAVLRMSQTSEAQAIQAAGVSLWRLIAPIMALAIVLSTCSAVTVNYLQPYTHYAYRALIFTVTRTAWNAAVQSGAFFEGFADTTALVDGVDRDGSGLRGLFAYRETPSGQSVIVTAERGRLHAAGNDRSLFLRLSDGVRARSAPDNKPMDAVRFDQFDLPLDVAFGGKSFHARGLDEEELTLPELWAARNHPPSGSSTALIWAEISHRLVRTLSILALPFLAVSLGIASRRERKSLTVGVGLVLLVLYHYVLQLGYGFAGIGRISPAVGLWLPFAIFTLGSLWAFSAAGRRPEGNLLSDTLIRLEAALRLGGRRREWQRGTG